MHMDPPIRPGHIVLYCSEYPVMVLGLFHPASWVSCVLVKFCIMVYVLVSLKLVGFESLLVHCLLGSLVSLSSASLPVCLCLCIFVLVSSFPSSVSIFPSLCFIHVSQVPSLVGLSNTPVSGSCVSLLFSVSSLLPPVLSLCWFVPAVFPARFLFPRHPQVVCYVHAVSPDFLVSTPGFHV